MKKILYFFLASMLLLSCDGMDVPDTGEGGTSDQGTTEQEKVHVLTLTADTYYIKAGSDDACEFAVCLNGEPLEEGFVIRNITAGTEHSGTSFSAAEVGETRFSASYELSEDGETIVLTTSPVTVEAVTYDVPAAVQDPDSSNLSFVKRVLFTQFTGTECTACPAMKLALYQFLAREDVEGKVVLAAAHCGIFTDGDPAKLNEGLDQALGANVKPHLDINLKQRSWQTTSGTDRLQSEFNAAYRSADAKGGIAVSPILDNGVLRIKVSVKAALKDKFRVGLWLLEDGIEGVQQGADSDDEFYTIHDKCVRAVCGEVKDQEDYSGVLLGDIDQGGTAEHVFEIPVEEKWVLENCHMAVFITTPNAKGKYYVNNVVDCPLTGQTPYEYK